MKKFKKLYSKMNSWYIPSLDIGVDLSDVQICDLSVSEAFEQIGDVYDDWPWEPEDGILLDGGASFSDFASLQEVNDFINKYSHIGAVSIMIRGGFVNLLKAYLSVNPPIAEYYDEMCQVLDGVGHKEAYEVLKAYNAETNA